MKKYRVGDTIVTLARIDLIILCYYWHHISKSRRKCSKITSKKIIYYLCIYDYNYCGVISRNIDSDLRKLFPVSRNNRKHTKYFTINNTLLHYWADKFNINFNHHKYSFETFKKIEDGIMSF